MNIKYRLIVMDKIVNFNTCGLSVFWCEMKRLIEIINKRVVKAVSLRIVEYCHRDAAMELSKENS